MLTSALGRDRLVIDRLQHTGKRHFDKSRIRLIKPDDHTAARHRGEARLEVGLSEEI